MDVYCLLKLCGLSARHQGFRALQKCVELALKDEEKLLSVTRLYQEVSASTCIRYENVERNIRTALDHAWKDGGSEQMKDLLGYHFSFRPTAGEMIELLVTYIQTHSD